MEGKLFLILKSWVEKSVLFGFIVDNTKGKTIYIQLKEFTPDDNNPKKKFFLIENKRRAATDEFHMLMCCCWCMMMIEWANESEQKPSEKWRIEDTKKNISTIVNIEGSTTSTQITSLLSPRTRRKKIFCRKIQSWKVNEQPATTTRDLRREKKC